jgi:hypothetical protein
MLLYIVITPVLYSPVISCSNRASSGGRTSSVSRSLLCFGTLSFTAFIGPCDKEYRVENGDRCQVVSVAWGEDGDADVGAYIDVGVCI